MPALRIPPSAALVILMATPFAAFCLGFLQLSIGLPAAALLVAGLLLGRGSACSEPVDGRALFASMMIALVGCLLGGQGRIVYAPDDWVVRDAVLADLVRLPWPPGYLLESGAFVLRAPVGMYLVPALVGKAAGLWAAHLALLLQNTAILGLLLFRMAGRRPGLRDVLVVAPLFLLFSGADVVIFLAKAAKAATVGAPAPWPWHLEHWNGLFQYSSHTTQLFWVPHHAFAGWFAAVLLIRWREGELGSPQVLSGLCLALLWSPFAVAGAVPFVIVAAVADLRARRLSLRTILGAALVGAATLPAVVYLTLDSDMVERELLISDPKFVPAYLLFLMVELAPFFWLLARFGNQASRSEIVLIGGLLLAFPLYKIGFSNDFTMRASIPALALLAMVVIEGARAATHAGRGALVPYALVFAIGVATPTIEIARAVLFPRNPPAGCDLVSAWRSSSFGGFPMSTYLAPVRPETARLLRATRAEAQDSGGCPEVGKARSAIAPPPTTGSTFR